MSAASGHAPPAIEHASSLSGFMALQPTLTTPDPSPCSFTPLGLCTCWSLCLAHSPLPWRNPTLSFKLPHSSPEGGEGVLGFPMLCLLWAPSASTIIFLDAVFRNLLFVHLFLHLTCSAELLEGRNHVMVMTEPPVPHTACRTVLDRYWLNGSVPWPHTPQR